MEMKLDDRSFRTFLDLIALEDLHEHARVNLSADICIDILLQQTANYSDYLSNIAEVPCAKEPESLSEKVELALSQLDEEALGDLMIAFTPEELLIDYMLEYCDEDARRDILENQWRWNKKAAG